MLHSKFGDELFTKLVNQKPALIQKITKESKQEAASSATAAATEAIKPDPAKE